MNKVKHVVYNQKHWRILFQVRKKNTEKGFCYWEKEKQTDFSKIVWATIVVIINVKITNEKREKKIHLKTVIERNGLLFIVHLFSDLLGFHLWYFIMVFQM